MLTINCIFSDDVQNHLSVFINFINFSMKMKLSPVRKKGFDLFRDQIMLIYLTSE